MPIDGKLAGIGIRETVDDVARIVGRQSSVVVWRTFAQSRSRGDGGVAPASR